MLVICLLDAEVERMQWGLHHTAMGIWADMFLVALNFQQDLIDLVNWQKVDKL